MKRIIPFALLAISQAVFAASTPYEILKYTSVSGATNTIPINSVTLSNTDNVIFTETVNGIEYTYRESDSLIRSYKTITNDRVSKTTHYMSNGTRWYETSTTTANAYDTYTDSTTASRELISQRILTADELSYINSFKTAEFKVSTGLNQIHAEAAYMQGYTGKGVTVAVIDTGYGVLQTKDRPTNMLAGVSMFGGTNTNDTIGHGTHVTGIIAAPANGFGTQGIAYNATILPIKAVDNTVSNPMTYIAKGIAYATKNNANIINISASSFMKYEQATKDNTLFNANFGDSYLKAVQAGTSIVVAAGNDGAACAGNLVHKYDYTKYNPIASKPLSCGFPGALPVVAGYESLTKSKGGYITVGAVDSNNNIAYFSNRAGMSKEWFIVAPGVSILSSASGSNNIVSKSGTSMAAPYVSGAMALLAEKYPYLTGAQHAEILFKTATDLGAPGIDEVYGNGLLNIERAMQPIGQLKLKTVSNTTSSIGTSTQSSVVNAALASLPEMKSVVLTDDYNRGFNVDLTNQFTSAQFSFDNLQTYNFNNYLVANNTTNDITAFGYKFNDTSVMITSNTKKLGYDGTFMRMSNEKSIGTNTLVTNLDVGQVNNYTGGFVNSVTKSTLVGGSIGIKFGNDTNTNTIGVRIPLTAMSGSANVSIPTAIDSNGQIQYTTKNVSLAQKVNTFGLYNTVNYQASKNSVFNLNSTLWVNNNKVSPVIGVTYKMSF